MYNTEAGHLLVEIGRGFIYMELVNSAIKRAVGESTTVSMLKRSTRVCILGIEELSALEEVIEYAFILVTGSGSYVQAVMQKMPRGKYMTIIMSIPGVASKVVG